MSITMIIKRNSWLDTKKPSTYSVGYCDLEPNNKKIEDYMMKITFNTGYEYLAVKLNPIPTNIKFPDHVVIRADYIATNEYSFPYIDDVDIINNRNMPDDIDTLFTTRPDMHCFLFRFYEKDSSIPDFSDTITLLRTAKNKAEEIFMSKYDSDDEFKKAVKNQMKYLYLK